MKPIIYKGGDTGALRDRFSAYAPEHSRHVPGEYRRIPGYADDGDEEEYRCYDDVVCLVQAGGLGAADRLLEKFLRAVTEAQRPVTGSWSSLVLAFDGAGGLRVDPQVLRGEFVYGHGILRWAEQLETCSSAGKPVAIPSMISELFPDPGAMAGKPKKRLTDSDLVLVFGRRGEFGFAAELERSLRRHRKRVVVIEVDGDRLEVTFDDAQRFLATAMASGAIDDAAIEPAAPLQREPRTANTDSEEDAMEHDPNWYRNWREYPASTADAWNKNPLSEDERAIARRIRAEEEAPLDCRPWLVERNCLDALERIFARGRRGREGSRQEHPLELIYLPELEECPIFGPDAIRKTTECIGYPYEWQRTGLPFLRGVNGRPCAWYRPLHFYGENWGIVVNTGCARALAGLYASYVDPADIAGESSSLVSLHLLRLATETLLQREFYRHKIEVYGMTLREVETTRRPGAYIEFYRGIRTANSDGTRDLENALAVAHARRDLVISRTGSRAHPAVLVRAAIRGLDWLLDQPECLSSYSDGRNFLDKRSHRVAEWEMMQRIQEGVAPTRLCGDHWQYAPQLVRSIMRVSSVPTWLV